MKTGLIHIYCGDGKGKTTAAVGQAVRAAGAGLKVCFCQFMKTGTSSELNILNQISDIDVISVENNYGFTWKMTDEDRAKLKIENDKALDGIAASLDEDKYQMVVFDEIISAYNNELIDKNKLHNILQKYTCYDVENEAMIHEKCCEIVLTGRNPAKELLEMANYITEMKVIRHPYEKGISARLGIEK